MENRKTLAFHLPLSLDQAILETCLEAMRALTRHCTHACLSVYLCACMLVSMYVDTMAEQKA